MSTLTLDRTDPKSWPFPKITNTRGQPVWHEVSEDHYQHMLEVLPPAIYGSGAFMVGEAAWHDAQGAWYTCFARTRDGNAWSYWARDLPLRDFAKAHKELLRHLIASPASQEGGGAT